MNSTSDQLKSLYFVTFEFNRIIFCYGQWMLNRIKIKIEFYYKAAIITIQSNIIQMNTKFSIIFINRIKQKILIVFSFEPCNYWKWNEKNINLILTQKTKSNNKSIMLYNIFSLIQKFNFGTR